MNSFRYFLRFAYQGAAYHGWQNQPDAISVQEVLEKALTTLLRREMSVVGAGRTDAGVHAKEMYAHFDSEEVLDEEALVLRLNAFLPNDVVVFNLVLVKEDAHARFDAYERTYEYWVTQEKNPFLFHAAHTVLRPLNMEAMNKAASILLEFNDFECFSKSNTDVKTFICVLKEAYWKKDNEKLIFTITADRFLRNMVRAVVGTLLEVGLGKRKVEDLREIIKSKDRSKAGFSVPTKGLYLTRVLYPDSTFK